VTAEPPIHACQTMTTNNVDLNVCRFLLVSWFRINLYYQFF